MRKLIILCLGLLIIAGLYYFLPRYTRYHLPAPSFPEKKAEKDKVRTTLSRKAKTAKNFTKNNNLSEEYAFFIDMNQPSGRFRFFVYDFKKDAAVEEGLVSHGSCNTSYLEKATFSNTPDQGCSSLGKYKVGYSYNGQFGKAYKLYGLDSTNSNAFKRFVVLHAYDCVPDKEVYPQPICNSLGCPMVSYDFLTKLTGYIQKTRKPMLLWIYQ